jgi:hypothetical protein
MSLCEEFLVYEKKIRTLVGTRVFHSFMQIEPGLTHFCFLTGTYSLSHAHYDKH